MLSKVQLSTGLVNFRGEKPSTKDEVTRFPESIPPKTIILPQKKDPLDETFTKFFGQQPADEFGLSSPVQLPSGDRIIMLQEKSPKLNKFPQVNRQKAISSPTPEFSWPKVPAGQVPTFDASAPDAGGTTGKPRLDKSQMLSDLRKLRGLSTEEPSILARLRTALPTGAPRPAGKPLDLNALRNVDWTAVLKKL